VLARGLLARALAVAADAEAEEQVEQGDAEAGADEHGPRVPALRAADGEHHEAGEDERRREAVADEVHPHL
jgi:hypothetical protein